MALDDPDLEPLWGIVDHRLNMIIEVRPCKKFKGAWVAFEAPGVEPAFPDPNGKQDAIDYARGRFRRSRGEIHVYRDDATTIEGTIVMDGRSQYPQVGGG
jgi:hypothetical protein